MSTQQQDDMDVTDITTLLDTYVLCRTLLHAWDPIPPPPTDEPYYGVREYLRCTRCGMIRYSTFSPFTGARTGNLQYVPPPGYATSRWVPRAEWRMEANRRQFFEPAKKPAGTTVKRAAKRARAR